MKKVFYAIGWIAFHFVKRAAITSLVVAIWIGSNLALSASGFSTSIVGSLASWAGVTTSFLTSTEYQVSSEKDESSNQEDLNG